MSLLKALFTSGEYFDDQDQDQETRRPQAERRSEARSTERPSRRSVEDREAYYDDDDYYDELDEEGRDKGPWTSARRSKSTIIPVRQKRQEEEEVPETPRLRRPATNDEPTRQASVSQRPARKEPERQTSAPQRSVRKESEQQTTVSRPARKEEPEQETTVVTQRVPREEPKPERVRSLFDEQDEPDEQDGAYTPTWRTSDKSTDRREATADQQVKRAPKHATKPRDEEASQSRHVEEPRENRQAVAPKPARESGTRRPVAHLSLARVLDRSVYRFLTDDEKERSGLCYAAPFWILRGDIEHPRSFEYCEHPDDPGRLGDRSVEVADLSYLSTCVFLRTTDKTRKKPLQDKRGRFVVADVADIEYWEEWLGRQSPEREFSRVLLEVEDLGIDYDFYA